MDKLAHPALATTGQTQQQSLSSGLKQQHLQSWEQAVDTVLQAKQPAQAKESSARSSQGVLAMAEVVGKAESVLLHNEEGNIPTSAVSRITATKGYQQTFPLKGTASETVAASDITRSNPHTTGVTSTVKTSLTARNILEQLNKAPVLREFLPRQRVQLVEDESGHFTLRLRDYLGSQEALLAQLQHVIQTTDIPLRRLVMNGRTLEFSEYKESNHGN